MTLIVSIRRHWLGIALSCMAVIFLGGALLGVNLYRTLYCPMSTRLHQPSTIVIDKSTSASSFVHQLEAQHLIQSGRLFLAFIRLQGLSHQLKAGVYEMHAGESAQQFLYRVVNGDVVKKSFSIIEGTTQAQVSKALQQTPYLLYNQNDWQVVAPFKSAEGLLLADTYYYNAGSPSQHVLALAHTNLKRLLEQCWQQRSPGLPYKTAYELLIAASIVEKESAIPHEKRLIAGVIANRLHKKMPLQMDPTVIYGLGSQYQGKLTRENLRIDSPYNSYRYRGLPPTPIAMVGKDALDAVAHPEQTDYLYFVARGDGHHYFSVNYEDQKQAVARYRKNNN